MDRRGKIGVFILVWAAAFNQWQAAVVFNRYNEHWIEGVMFHVMAVGVLLGIVPALNMLRRK